MFLKRDGKDVLKFFSLEESEHDDKQFFDLSTPK